MNPCWLIFFKGVGSTTNQPAATNVAAWKSTVSRTTMIFCADSSQGCRVFPKTGGTFSANSRQTGLPVSVKIFFGWKRKLIWFEIHNLKSLALFPTGFPCMIYLPTFTIKMNQLEANRTYVDPMGFATCTFQSGCHFYTPRDVKLTPFSEPFGTLWKVKAYFVCIIPCSSYTRFYALCRWLIRLWCWHINITHMIIHDGIICGHGLLISYGTCIVRKILPMHRS